MCMVPKEIHIFYCWGVYISFASDTTERCCNHIRVASENDMIHKIITLLLGVFICRFKLYCIVVIFKCVKPKHRLSEWYKMHIHFPVLMHEKLISCIFLSLDSVSVSFCGSEHILLTKPEHYMIFCYKREDTNCTQIRYGAQSPSHICERFYVSSLFAFINYWEKSWKKFH